MMSRRRRTGGQEEVTPLTPDPFVSIQRNPVAEAAIARLKKKNVKFTSSGPEKCFLCGGGTLSSVTLPRRHSYLRQVECFKTYLTRIRTLDGVETCARCLQDIKDVWELNQEIEAIKENISQIVEKVTASGGGEAITNKVLKKIPGPKSRRPAESGQGSNTPNRSSNQGFSTSQNVESMEYQCDPDLLFEVKQEVFWNKEEIHDDAVSDTENCFAVTPESDDSSLADPQAVQNSSKQVSRPKRNSRVAAEKILRRVVASERRKKEIPDDDQSEEGEDPVISEPEDSNSEEVTDSESDTSDGPPKEKRLKKSSIPSRTCPHCKKVFKNARSLQDHIRTVHLLKLKCDHCPKTFATNKTRNQHIAWNHTNETFPCSSCSKKLATQKRWAIHQTLVCKVNGWTPERLQKEFKVKLFPCPEDGCDKLLDRPSEVTKHLITHTGLKPFSCSPCGKYFTSKTYLHRHFCQGVGVERVAGVGSSHSTESRQETFPCSACSKALVNKRRWAVHEATLCKVDGWTEERLAEFNVTLHPCSVEGCDKVFDELYRLRRHLITHTEYPRPRPPPPAMEKVLCDLCGTSMDPRQLNKHMKRVHQGQRPLSCPHCEKRFFSSNDRSRHIATVHERKKDHNSGGSHICQECGVQYPYKSSLYQHMARVHGDESKVKYQCGSCPEKFYARNELLRHEERHLKYGWCCGDCGRNFESERKLEKHQESLDGVLCAPRKRTRRLGKVQIEDGVVIVESELQNVPEEGK